VQVDLLAPFRVQQGGASRLGFVDLVPDLTLPSLEYVALVAAVFAAESSRTTVVCVTYIQAEHGWRGIPAGLSLDSA
jgi:hypothetical protein